MIFRLALILSLWFPVQDLALAFVYGLGAPAGAIRALILAKEGLVACMLLGAMLRLMLGTPLRAAWTDLLAFAYGLLITVYLPFGDAELPARLAQYRSLVLPVLLYFAGRTLPEEPEAVQRWTTWTIRLGVGLAVFGFIERFALDVNFWRGAVPLGHYLVDIKSQGEHMIGDLPGNMFGDYGFGYFQFRRLSSAFGSPLTMGYYLVFPCVLLLCAYLVHGTPRRLLAFCVCGIAMLLTVTRAGMGAVLIALAGALLLYREVRLIVVGLVLGAGLLILFEDTIINVLVATLTLNDSSTRGHVLFLESSLEVVKNHPMGLGIGLAGGWSHTMSTEFSGAAENAFLVIIAQAGIYAGLLFLAFCGAAFWELRAQRSVFARACALSLAGYLATGMLSEQILTFTSIAHFWISLGYAITCAKNHADWT